MKGSRSKKTIALILAGIMSISVMASCKAQDKNEVVCRTREDKIRSSPKVNLNVRVDYDGWGEDGEPLGSGEFEYDLECYEGMMLFEDGGGYYKDEQVWDSEDPTIVIKEINEDGVLIKTHNDEQTISYGESVDFDPFYWTYDGTNYFSTLTFEEPDD